MLKYLTIICHKDYVSQALAARQGEAE